MPADPGEIRLRFRVLLVPLTLGDQETPDRHAIAAGIVELPFRITPTAAGPVMRDPASTTGLIPPY